MQNWLAFYHLHDIPNMNTKFDKNRPYCFWTDGQTDRQRNGQSDRWTDRQAETGDLFFHTVSVTKGRENVKIDRRTRFAYGRAVKTITQTLFSHYSL